MPYSVSTQVVIVLKNTWYFLCSRTYQNITRGALAFKNISRKLFRKLLVLFGTRLLHISLTHNNKYSALDEANICFLNVHFIDEN